MRLTRVFARRGESGARARLASRISNEASFNGDVRVAKRPSGRPDRVRRFAE